MAKFNHGYKSNPKNTRVKPMGMMRLASDPSKTSADLESYCPITLDQNSTSSCTGHGTSVGIFARLSYLGIPLGWIPSPLSIYKGGRSVERAIENPDLQDPTVVQLTDNGTMPVDVMTAINLYGIRPMKAPNSFGQNSDCEPSNINEEIMLGELEEMLKNVVVGEYGITSTGKQRVVEYKTCLDNGMPVCFGTAVDTLFEEWTPDQPVIGVPDPLQVQGGHWLVCIGYRTNPVMGELEFKVRNSWYLDETTPWGDNGNCWVNEAFIMQVSDSTVMDVQLKKVA